MRRRFTPELAQKILAHYQRIPTLRILAHQPFVCWIMATMYNRFLDRQGYGNNPPRLTPVITNLFLIQLNRRLSYYYYQPEVKTVKTIKCGPFSLKNVNFHSIVSDTVL